MESEELTPEEVRYWYGEQSESGIDLIRLRANLSLTPTERYHQHNRALASVLKFREAVRIARDRESGRSA